MTVIVAIPTVFPVTTPVLLTVAILISLLSHVTFLFVLSSGFSVTVKVTVFPSLTVAGFGVIVILSTGIFVAEIIYAYSYPSIRYVLEQEKQIVLFGAGGMCQKVVQEQEFPVAFIVDNDIEKDGIQVGGVTVVWSGNMDEWDKYFYLITPQDAHEIIIQLENKGLKSGEDFMQIKWETKDMMVLSAS